MLNTAAAATIRTNYQQLAALETREKVTQTDTLNIHL